MTSSVVWENKQITFTMLTITLKQLQCFKAFGFADSKLNCKILLCSFNLFFNLDVSGRNSTRIHELHVQIYVILYDLKRIYYVQFWGDVITLLMGMVKQSWLAFTIYMIFMIKFDNNRSDNVWEYLSNKNRQKQRTDRRTDGQTDRQTDKRKRDTHFFVLYKGG